MKFYFTKFFTGSYWQFEVFESFGEVSAKSKWVHKNGYNGFSSVCVEFSKKDELMSALWDRIDFFNKNQTKEELEKERNSREERVRKLILESR